MVPRNDSELLAEALMIGGKTRFTPARLAAGSSTTSLSAPATVFRSATTLRPLVSVPAIDGNLPASSPVAPAATIRSAIAVVCWDSVPVAGAAAAIRSASS